LNWAHGPKPSIYPKKPPAKLERLQPWDVGEGEELGDKEGVALAVILGVAPGERVGEGVGLDEIEGHRYSLIA